MENPSPKKKKARLTAVQKAEVAGRRLFHNEKCHHLAAEYDIHRATVGEIAKAHSTPGSDLLGDAFRALEQYRKSRSTSALPELLMNTRLWYQAQQMGVAAVVQSRDSNFRVGNTEDNPPQAAAMSTISVSTHNSDPPIQDNPISEAVSTASKAVGFEAVSAVNPGFGPEYSLESFDDLTPRLKQRILGRAVECGDLNVFVNKLLKVGIDSVGVLSVLSTDDMATLGLSSEEFDVIKMNEVDWEGKSWIKKVLAEALPEMNSNSKTLRQAEERMKCHKIYTKDLLLKYCENSAELPVLKIALKKYLQRNEITSDSSHGISDLHSSNAAQAASLQGVETRENEGEVGKDDMSTDITKSILPGAMREQTYINNDQADDRCSRKRIAEQRASTPRNTEGPLDTSSPSQPSLLTGGACQSHAVEVREEGGEGCNSTQSKDVGAVMVSTAVLADSLSNKESDDMSTNTDAAEDIVGAALQQLTYINMNHDKADDCCSGRDGKHDAPLQPRQDSSNAVNEDAPKDNYQDGSMQIETEHGENQPKSPQCLYRKFNTLIRRFPDTNLKGVSGHLQEKYLCELISYAAKEIRTTFPLEELDLVDLGCGIGRVLVFGAFTKEFAGLYGIDLPRNEGIFSNTFEAMCNMVERDSELRPYLEKIRSIKFYWKVAGQDDLSSVWNTDPKKLVYCFCAGWERDDVTAAAKSMSLCNNVVGAIFIPILRGHNASLVLDALNGSGGHFVLQHKISPVVMSGGHSSFTAFIYVRKEKRSHDIGQSVEVLFDDGKWYQGSIAAYIEADGKEQIRIEFEDGDEQIYGLHDPEICYSASRCTISSSNGSMPIRSEMGMDLDSEILRVCSLCSESLERSDTANIICSRCQLFGFHLRCLGAELCDTNERTAFCMNCRAELADNGCRQIPTVKPIVSTVKRSARRKIHTRKDELACSGCGTGIVCDEFVRCNICKFVFGDGCCSGRIKGLDLEYRCCGCVGVRTHDEAHRVYMIIASAEVDIILASSNEPDADSSYFLDRYARAVSVLQDNAMWDLLREFLPTLWKLTTWQLENKFDVSLAIFDALKLGAASKEPDMFKALCRDSGIRFGACVSTASAAGAVRVCAARSTALCKQVDMERGQNVILGFITSDLRAPSPLWHLMKVALLYLAPEFKLFLYCILGVGEAVKKDDCYKLLETQCTVREFHGAYEDVMADESVLKICSQIKEDGVQILIDLGGPTSCSPSKILAMRPSEVQGLFLGYPGTLPCWDFLDFFIVDQIVLPLTDFLSAGHVSFVFLPCYQPNAGFKPPGSWSPKSCSQNSVVSRKQLGLPDDAVVMGYFASLGRLDDVTLGVSWNWINVIADIMIVAPNTVLWLRNHPSPAALRIVRKLVALGVDKGRVILACDVEQHLHILRLQFADLLLDSPYYTGHTSCSDGLQAGVPVVAICGEEFCGRVSTSLVTVAFGDEDLISKSPEEFKAKVVPLVSSDAESQAKRDECKAHLRKTREDQTGIFGGKAWADAFSRGVKEVYRRAVEKKLPCDIFTVQRMNSFSREGIPFVTLLENRNPTADLHCEGGAQSSDDSVFCPRDSAAGVSLTVDIELVAQDVEWLRRLAKVDRNRALASALDFLAKTMPKDRSIHYFRNKATNSLVPAIQLPCDVPVRRTETGGLLCLMQLTLVYVSPCIYGLGLFAGAEFNKKTKFTFYDGKAVSGKDVKDHTRAISLSFSEDIKIDCMQTDELEMLRCNSLGCFANHGYPSVAKYKYFEGEGPISQQRQCIVLTARGDGSAHQEITGFYTRGAAARHGIPARAPSPGKVAISANVLVKLDKQVSEGIKVLQSDGYDVLELLGQGSFGSVVKCKSASGHSFAVKLGRRRYDRCARLDILVEALIMDMAASARLREDEVIGEFSLGLYKEAEWVTGAALLDVCQMRTAAVFMECATRSARDLLMPLWQSLMRNEAGNDAYVECFRDFLAGTLRVVAWMHAAGLAHGDLKASNIFMIEMQQPSSVARLASWLCNGTRYQIVLGDWGLSRWYEKPAPPSVSQSAKEVMYTSCGSKAPSIPGFEFGSDEISGQPPLVRVGKRDLHTAFGLRKHKVHHRHPGPGTEYTRAPNSTNVDQFRTGQEQRVFDQASDIWALGVTVCRFISFPCLPSPAGPDVNGSHNEQLKIWARKLSMASQAEHNAQRRAVAPATPRARGLLHVSSAGSSTRQDCFGSWLAGMVSHHYRDSSWPRLNALLSGARGQSWLALLRSLEKLLCYDYKERATAKDACTDSVV